MIHNTHFSILCVESHRASSHFEILVKNLWQETPRKTRKPFLEDTNVAYIQTLENPN